MPSDIRDMKGKKQKDLLWQKRVYKDPSGYKEMKRLYRMLDQLLRVPSSRKAGDRQSRRGMGGSPSQQLCIVKARIRNTLEGHRKFLTQYLPQENKSRVTKKPQLFGYAGDGADGEEDPVTAYQDRMTDRHFKFIISPENQRVDAEVLMWKPLPAYEQAKNNDDKDAALRLAGGFMNTSRIRGNFRLYFKDLPRRCSGSCPCPGKKRR
jgi:hypothetical protein